MPSPFPGMNPYLEQDDVWHDFHERFLPHLAEVIGSQLAAHYIVKIDEHVYIHEPSAERRTLLGRGDVLVASRQPAPEGGTATALAGAPAQVVLPSVDVEGVSYLEIRDRRERRLVTVVELLSPANKYSGPDREQYLGKRGGLLASSAHLVEIDLLRGGPRCRSPGRRRSVSITRWSAGWKSGRPPTSGRSGCATRCQWSPSRYGPPTRTFASTCKRRCTTSTTRLATGTTFTMGRPSRG